MGVICCQATVFIDQSWNLQEGNKIFSGGADHAGRMFDVTTGQATQVAQHEAPIKVVGWVDAPGAGILATGSWDKTIKVTLLLLAFCYFLPTNSTVLGSPHRQSCGHSSTSRKMLYF